MVQSCSDCPDFLQLEHGDTVHEHCIDASGYISLTVESLMFLSFSSFTLPPCKRFLQGLARKILISHFVCLMSLMAFFKTLAFQTITEGAILSNFLINFRLLIFLGSTSLP